MIYDERDVGYFLGVPVVALIPETLTQERGAGRRANLTLRAVSASRRTWRGGGSAPGALAGCNADISDFGKQVEVT